MVLGAASASDSPCATTCVAPNTLVRIGVATTAPPTPNKPPMVPLKQPNTPSQGQGWRSSGLAGAALINRRATFHRASATRKPTKPRRMACASTPTAQIEPNQANTKLHTDNGKAWRNSMRLRW
ncbi:hypothetical protein D3C73_1056840 [compost metagenome]